MEEDKEPGTGAFSFLNVHSCAGTTTMAHLQDDQRSIASHESYRSAVTNASVNTRGSVWSQYTKFSRIEPPKVQGPVVLIPKIS